MKHKNSLVQVLTAGSALAFLALATGNAAITSVTETNLGADVPAVIGNNFAEDSLTFSDRTHQHNGAAYNSFDGLLSTTGDTIVPLPTYLLGNDYVLLANDARDQRPYDATVTSDQPTQWYLLLDNRIDGLAGTAGSPNNSDPVLGGNFQWVIDGGWERVNTGIMPNGQADYTGVDEGGESVGAGVGLNQFYSIWTLETPSTEVTISNNGTGGSNMVSLVAGIPISSGDLITAFSPAPSTISEGDTSSLSWLISEGATVATIDQGIGDILPLTTDGAGDTMVSPAVTTSYTLDVEDGVNPAESVERVVVVQLLNSFTTDNGFLSGGESAILSWDVRSDASVSIAPDVGNVDLVTDANGVGSISVSPADSTTYTITASGMTAGGMPEEESASVAIGVAPAGTVFALIDIGATDGQPEPGAVGTAADPNITQIGAAPAGTNATNLLPTALVSNTGSTFTIAMDNVAPGGVAVGNLDWRDRGNAPIAETLALLGEDLVKNNGGMIRVTLGSLPAGAYDVTSWHADPTFDQSEAIQILVTDANGTAVDTGILGSALFAPNLPPAAADLTTTIMLEHAAVFSFTSNGADDVILYFDGRGATDTEVPINGLQLNQSGPPFSFEITDIDYNSGQPIITWNSIDGRSYAVEFQDTLSGQWIELEDATGDAGSTSLTDVINLPADRRFYRVRDLDFEP